MKKVTNKDLDNMMIIFANILAENPKYFVKPTVYSFLYEDDDMELIKEKNLFRKKIPVPVLALKIIHNYVMFNYMYFQYAIQVNYIKDSFKFEETNNRREITMQIDSENINVINSKGFDMNNPFVEQEMALVLSSLPMSFIDYIEYIIDDNDKYKEIYEVLKFLNKQKSENLLDINTAIALLIKENIDMYDDYL